MKKEVQSHLMNILHGSYRLKRNIDDPYLAIEGSADFYHESKHCIRYQEHGYYFLNHTKQQFYQERYFIFEGETLTICTSDKAVLHEFSLYDAHPPSYHFSHVHLCHHDEYLLSLHLDHNVIIMDYQVRGPLKRYDMQTALVRSTEDHEYDPNDVPVG